MWMGTRTAGPRSWSRVVSTLDIFIFVTPQYNWGLPAALKNAIDRVYHEWRGKSAIVVSYGGHGGDKCNRQLQEVLQGLKMNVVGGVTMNIPVGVIPLPEGAVTGFNAHNEEILQLVASCVKSAKSRRRVWFSGQREKTKQASLSVVVI